MKIARILFGPHQQLFSFVAVVIGSLALGLWAIDRITESQVVTLMVVFPMLYVSAVISAIFNKTWSHEYRNDKNYLIGTFWKFTKIPYVITCFVAFAYLVNFNLSVAMALVYSGLVTTCFLIFSVVVWAARGRPYSL